jgi:tetratricopeptide (TPR) repeat protein
MKKVLILLVLICGIFNNSFSYGKWIGKWRPSAMPVPYYINLTSFPDGSEAAITASFDAWQQASRSFFRATYAGTTTRQANRFPDGYNVISMGTVFYSTSIAETWPTSLDGNDHFVELDIVFDKTRSFSATPYCPSNCFDVQNIATHEIGHFVGLDHDSTTQYITMYPSASMGEIYKRTLEQDDKNGVLDIYRIIYVPKDEPTIHQACNYAVRGQTILVSPGTYTETLAVTVPDSVTLQLPYGVTVNFNSTLTVNGELKVEGATINCDGITAVNGVLQTNGGSTLNYHALAISSNGEFYANNSIVTCSSFNLNGYMEVNILNLTCSGSASITGYLWIEGAYSNLTFSSGLTLAGGNIMSRGAQASLSGKTKFWLGGNGLTISSGDVEFIYTDFYPRSPYWNSITINGSSFGMFTYCTIDNPNGTYGISANGGWLAMEYTRVVSKTYGLSFANYSQGFIHSYNAFDFSDYNIKSVSSGVNAGNGSIGYNAFRGTGAYHIYNESAGTIFAWNNYWAGGIPKISKYNNSYYNVHASYPELFDPTPYVKLVDGHETEETEIESGIFLKETVVKDNKPIEKVPGIEELDRATILLYSEEYEKAFAEMHRLVAEYKDGYVGKRALVFIEVILVKTERAKDILPMLEQYSNGNSKVAQFAHYRKVYQYFRLKEHDKAIEIMKSTEFSEEDADLRQARLYDLGVAYHDFLGKKAEAYRYFDELVKTYPDCPLAEVANTVYRLTKDGYEKPTVDEDKEIAIVPTETKLFANYPNPFNPSTVIKYQLADASQVSLKVYDVMGREVATLVNSYQNKGSYEVTFNANGLASGIYFYKLNAGGKQFINKMLLMK